MDDGMMGLAQQAKARRDEHRAYMRDNDGMLDSSSKELARGAHLSKEERTSQRKASLMAGDGFDDMVSSKERPGRRNRISDRSSSGDRLAACCGGRDALLSAPQGEVLSFSAPAATPTPFRKAATALAIVWRSRRVNSWPRTPPILPSPAAAPRAQGSANVPGAEVVRS